MSTLINQIYQILNRLNKDKPWMTARGLSKRLRKLNITDKTPSEIEKVLIRHSKSSNNIIRQSYYPSKKSLDILWGSIDVVGKQIDLPNLERGDEPTPKNIMNFDKNTVWFFLSHNQKDLHYTKKIKRKIESNVTTNFAIWTHEVEIPHEEIIIHYVRNAIRDCDYFISYVTRQSIGSLWVQKEAYMAKNPIIIIDGSDDELLNIFLNWEKKWSPELDLVTELANKMKKGNKWTKRSKDFMYRLDEFMKSSNQIVAFPYPKDDSKTKGKSLKILSLDEFIGKLAIEK